MRILSGIQSSGKQHIGNYYGALRQFVDLQNRGDEALYFIANLHALTTVSGRVSEVAASTRIGVSAGLTFRIVGGYGMPVGKYACAALIADSVSATAPSIGRLKSNCSVSWV